LPGLRKKEAQLYGVAVLDRQAKQGDEYADTYKPNQNFHNSAGLR
jgi:hypothetical protein